MVLNYIWIGFFVIGFVCCPFRFAVIFRDFLQARTVFDQADRDISRRLYEHLSVGQNQR
jgi:hypothetical protein